MLYIKGEGIPQDFAKATKWLRLAAAQGHVKAQKLLGWVYVNGRGVPQDTAEAVRWIRRVAEQAGQDQEVYARAWQVYLGGMYYKGLPGVPKDAAEAARWFQLAAEQDPTDDMHRYQLNPYLAYLPAMAQYLLGMLYDAGEGMPQNDAKATKCFAEAAKWFQLVAEQGLAEAQLALGLMYYEGGRGVQKNFNEAVKLFRLAAEQGLAEAQFNLGLMYYKGVHYKYEGVTQNYPNAYVWLSLATASGYSDAKGFRDIAGWKLSQAEARGQVEVRVTAQQKAAQIWASLPKQRNSQ